MLAQALSVLRGSGWMLLPHMPLIGPSYSKKDIFHDALAGLTVAAVLIPQSIGYALLAGLPPASGLYAALVAGVAGSLWGSSRYLATGPIAIASLLTLSAVSSLAPAGSLQFIALVATLALMVGVIQITLGLARLGYLVRLVPQSVLVGFSSAAALIIAMTQIPYLFGFHASSGTFVALQIFNIIRHIAQTRPLTMLIGISALGLLIALRRFVPKYPASLALLVLGIAVSYFFDLAGHGVTIAGSIPARLPITDIPMLSPAVIFSLAGNAFVIALVGFMSSYVVVKEMAGRGKDTVSADQELIGQGFANLFAGIFHGYPVGGSLSRTAVNYEAGATTAWSGVFASIIVALSILFLSPLISYLPNAVLAAIVIAAAASLVDVPHIRRIHQISTMDGAIAGTTFAASFVLQASDAIFIGVVLALAMFLHRMMWADVVEVGIDRSLNVLRAIRDERDEEQGLVRLPRTLVLRINSSFFYGNSERLIEKMKSAILEREAIGGETLDFLVLECAGIDIIDGTAIEALEVFLNDLDARGTELCLIYMRRHVREVLERASDLERVRVVHNISELRQITQNKRRESTHGVEGLAIRTGIHRMTETPTA